MSNTLRMRSYLAMGVSAIAIAAVAAPAFAQTAPAAPAKSTAIEEVVVTAQRKEETLQDVPVAVSAFSGETLKTQRIESGQDLLKAIPNVNFARGNFGGFNFQVRGIGTKTVGTSADGGISVHENDVPLVSSGLGDGDFFDIERVEVLRGPQGTLFGRNATGGVVNIITAKPVNHFAAEATGEYGNFNSQRLKGYVNVPIGDTLSVRLAGSYFKRDGMAENIFLHEKEDDRDMWSSRLSVNWAPSEKVRFNLMWERSREDDNRDRVGKQLCIADPGKATIGGVATNAVTQNLLSQGCANGSLYQQSAYGVFNSAESLAGIFSGAIGLSNPGVNGNAGATTPNDWRKWASGIMPIFKREGDFYSLKAEFEVTDNLLLINQTSYATGTYFTRADYNRAVPTSGFTPTGGLLGVASAAPGSVGAPIVTDPNCGPIASGSACMDDPQVGRTNALRTIDFSTGTNRQFSEEMRIQSSFSTPLNFSAGVNFVNFKTTTDYYVLSNGLTAPVETIAKLFGVPYPLDFSAQPTGEGANYYDNRTDYRLGAYAAFGEVYYQANEDLKFTAGVRYSVDRKWDIAHGVRLLSAAEPNSPVQTVAFKETTGRLNVEWTPHLGFTDRTLVYATYSRGYKPGGFNPGITPGLAIPVSFNSEFVNAFEVGTKNVLLDGSMILNATAFHYDYTGYQISAIVNRNSVNTNIDAKVYGAELEAIWEPVQNLRVNGTMGYLHTEITNGATPDQLDLTNGDSSLSVIKDIGASNCAVKTSDLATVQSLINAANASASNPQKTLLTGVMSYLTSHGLPGLFGNYNYLMTCTGINAATGLLPAFTAGAIHLSGFGNTTGVNVNLKGHELPNSPKITANIGVQYEYHVGDAWTVTPRADFYYQDKSFSRIFNSEHDRLKAYSLVNLSLVVERPDSNLTVQAYVKNLFDKDYIQDQYLTDASSGLFTNIFIGDPRTYGLAVTKRF